jgi:3-hydroxybutyryl-CoA dehydrogenase
MKYSKPANYKQRPIVIIGAGTLGMRIALMMATQGIEVHIFDISAEQLKKAESFTQLQLPDLLKKYPACSQAKVVLFDSLTKALENAWLVYESSPELLDLKIDIFEKLEKLSPPDAILASNSSSYPSSQLIDKLSKTGRERVVNTHYYMPPLANAVEIMSCGFTDPGVIDMLMDSLPGYAGLVPFHVLKESVGFIYNRVWASIKREFLEVVSSGVSTPEDVDNIWSVITGSKIGLFRQMDMVGLDVALEIEEHYSAINPALPKGPRTLLQSYVSAGKLGIKSGHGFYNYQK